MKRLNTFLKTAIAACLGIITQSGFAQTYSVDINMPVTQMVQNLVGNGVQISNVSVTACDSTYGYYNSVNTELGTSQGLLMTTGKALYSIGPNNSIGNCSTSAGTCDFFDNGCPGSTLLNQAQNRITRDATTIEFDIVPLGDSLKFKYTFASEEYNEWVNSPFNDVFGFYISGPNVGTNVNIALVPGSNQVVSINTVNLLSNPQYFYNNQNPLGQNIQYDGFTRNLIAKVGNLEPCQTYHLKLIIADGTDRVYDSGVFIEAIESNPVSVITATTNGLEYLVEGCNTGTITFSRLFATPLSQDVTFSVNGSATNGEDYLPQIGNVPAGQNQTIVIPANEQSVSFDLNALVDGITEGQEYITIKLNNPFCNGPEVIDSINFYIYDQLEVDLLPNVSTICVGQCVDLEGTSSVLGVGTFEWSSNVSDGTILTPSICPTEPALVTFTVTAGECSATDSLQINFSNIEVALTTENALCPSSATGSASSTLTAATEPIQYVWTGPDGYSSSSSSISDVLPGEYCLDVTDANGCIASACAIVDSNNEAPFSISLSTTPALCPGSLSGSVSSSTTGTIGAITYAWSGPDGYISDQANLSNVASGEYCVTITDGTGCSSQSCATVDALSTPPVNIDITTTPTICQGSATGAASAVVTGATEPATYSWNGPNGYAATGLSISDLEAGTYCLDVTDGAGCVTTACADVTEPGAAAFSVSISSTPTSCAASSTGSATATFSGAVEPVTFIWSGENGFTATQATITNLPIGEYCVNATDANGCEANACVTIVPSSISPFTVSVATTPTLCPNSSTGAAVANTGGLALPASFTWSGPNGFSSNTTSISDLIAGTYCVQVTDANGCLLTACGTVAETNTPSFTLSFDVTDALCEGSSTGSISVTAVGSVAPISIVWTGPNGFTSDAASLTGLAPGEYCVEIIDATGCSNTACTSVGANTQPYISVDFFSTDVICAGSATGSIDATVNGALAPYTASWVGPNGYTNSGTTIFDIEAGVYCLNITDAAGCSVLSCDTVNVPASSPIQATFDVTNVFCEGGSSGAIEPTITGAALEYTISWSGPNDFTSNEAIVTGLEAGEYCLTIVDAIGCENTMCTTVVQNNELTAFSTLSDYSCNQITCPGACDGSIDLAISGGVGPYSIEWTNASGFSSTDQSVANLCAGQYSVTITDAVGCVYTNDYLLTEPEPVVLNVVGSVDLLCTGVETGQASVQAVGGCAPYTYIWSHDATVTGPVAIELGSGTYEVNVTDQNGCANDASVTIVINDPIDPLDVAVDAVSLYANGYNVSCPDATDGFINLTISGGTTPYTINWLDFATNTVVSTSEDLTDVACGNYQVTVTDGNGCEYTQSFNLFCVPNLDVTLDITNNACGSGTSGLGAIDVLNTTGGSGGPYTYEWNGPSCAPCSTEDISGLNSGDYTLVITDANGCTKTVVANIGQNDAFTADGVATDPSCAGSCDGSIDITAGDGSTPPVFTLGASTDVQICFTAEHSWVSDLAFHLVGPASCGSPDIILSPNPGTNCNSCCVNGDGVPDVNNLCFSSASSANFNMCDFANTALTGTFGTYGAGVTPIDWTPLYGCNINEPGWAVQVYDCVGADFGSLIDATMTFTGTDTGGNPQTTVFSTPAGFNSPINDNSCNAASASIFSVEQISGGGGSGGGAAGNFSFQWSGPFSGPAPTTEDVNGLCAGTYTVTITQGDCVETLSFELQDPEPLVILPVTLVNPTCFGQNNGSIDVDVIGGSGNFSYDWAPNASCFFFGASTQDINNLSECSYSLTVTDVDNGCTANYTVDLDAPEVMELTIVTSQYDGGYNIGCAGGNDGQISVFVTGGTSDPVAFAPYDYLYDWITDCSDIDPSAYGNDPNAPNPQNLPGGAYGINVTDANGCLATTCLNLLEPDSLSSPSIIQNIDCNNATGCITPNVSGGSNNYLVYEWTGDIAGNDPSSATLCGLSADTYSLTVTDSNGCQETFEYTIEDQGAPSATLTAQTPTTCSNTCDGTATIEVTGGAGTYVFNVDGGADSTFTSPLTVTDLCGGAHVISITDDNGCAALIDVTISGPAAVGITLTAVVQEPTQVYSLQCFGDSSGAITSAVTGGVGSLSYLWTFGTDTISFDPNIDSLIAGNYCLTVTDSIGCVSQQCLDITQPDSLLTTTGDLSIYNLIYNVSCSNANDGSIDVTVEGGVAPYTYEWNGSGTVNGQEDQSNLTSGIYEVLVVDANFCTNTVQFVLDAPTAIDINPSVTEVTCNGLCNGAIDITPSGSVGPYSISWAGANGFSSTDEDLTGLCAGFYDVTVVDSINCSYTESIQVNEPDVLGGVIQATYNCNTGAIQLCANPSGGTAPYSYAWSTGDDALCIEVTTSGNYCLDITDANGCTFQVCIDADPSTAISIAGVVSNANCGFCNGAVDVTVTGGVAPLTYSWATTQTTEDINSLCGGTYVVTVSDVNGCIAAASFDVGASDSLTVDIQSTGAPCAGDNGGTAAATVTGGSLPYTFNWFDASGALVGTEATASELSAGVYTLNVVDPNGCAASVDAFVTEPDSIDVDIMLSMYDEFNISSNGQNDGEIHLDITGGTPTYTIDWAPVSLPDTTTHATGLTAGEYTIHIEDANGCALDTVITLTQPEDVQLYTAISPNGDGFNDVYVIDGVLNCNDNIFKVFNRWGNLVYEKKNYQNDWYGQNTDGSVLSDGTYFIIYEGCDVEFNTYVDLRRE
jgi:gliding motility-associated-like protein